MEVSNIKGGKSVKSLNIDGINFNNVSKKEGAGEKTKFYIESNHWWNYSTDNENVEFLGQINAIDIDWNQADLFGNQSTIIESTADLIKAIRGAYSSGGSSNSGSSCDCNSDDYVPVDGEVSYLDLNVCDTAYIGVQSNLEIKGGIDEQSRISIGMQSGTDIIMNNNDISINPINDRGIRNSYLFKDKLYFGGSTASPYIYNNSNKLTLASATGSNIDLSNDVYVGKRDNGATASRSLTVTGDITGKANIEAGGDITATGSLTAGTIKSNDSITSESLTTKNITVRGVSKGVGGVNQIIYDYVSINENTIKFSENGVAGNSSWIYLDSGGHLSIDTDQTFVGGGVERPVDPSIPGIQGDFERPTPGPVDPFPGLQTIHPASYVTQSSDLGGIMPLATTTVNPYTGTIVTTNYLDQNLGLTTTGLTTGTVTANNGLDVKGNINVTKSINVSMYSGSINLETTAGLIDLCGQQGINVKNSVNTNTIEIWADENFILFNNEERGHTVKLSCDEDGFIVDAGPQGMHISGFGDLFVDNGDIYATQIHGTIDQRSDESVKNIVGDVNITVNDIADTRLVKYSYIDDKDNKIHVGTIAQDWENVLPEVVNKDNKGVLSLDYNAINIASSITLAREVRDLKETVKKLSERVVALESK